MLHATPNRYMYRLQRGAGDKCKRQDRPKRSRAAKQGLLFISIQIRYSPLSSLEEEETSLNILKHDERDSERSLIESRLMPCFHKQKEIKKGKTELSSLTYVRERKRTNGI